MPNTQNVPAISGKGEGSLNLAGNDNQVEIQGGYGLSDRTAVQLNSGYFSPASQKNGEGTGSGFLIEGGYGYYKPLSPVFLFDTYGLLGFGHMQNHFPASAAENPGTSGKISAYMFRFGVQPGIHLLTKYFSVSFSSRIAGLQYSGISGDLIFSSEDQHRYLTQNQTHFLVEPAFTIRLGLQKLKLQAQILRSINVTDEGFRQEKALLSLGIHYHFEK